MGKVLRALVALVVVAGISVVTGPSAAATKLFGASQSLYVIDVVVRGTPPPGASIKVFTEATFEENQEHTVDLAAADTADPDIVVEVGTVTRLAFVMPDFDADATTIDYSCEMTGFMTEPHPSSFCEKRTTPQPPAPGTHVHAEFWGNVNQHALTTITLTFGTCGGVPVTTFLSEGEVPTTGSDVILGTNGSDAINGLGGADSICALGGADTVNGGYGSDIVDGGAGSDVVIGGQHPDAVYGGPGPDAVYGLEGADYLDGGTETDGCDGGTETDLWANCEFTANLP